MIFFKYRLFFPLLAVIAFAFIVLLIKFVSPDYQFSIARYKFSIFIPFFLLSFLFLASFITGITKRKLQGFLSAVFINTYLLLRLFGFTQLLYGILLVVLFIALEIAFGNFVGRIKR